MPMWQSKIPKSKKDRHCNEIPITHTWLNPTTKQKNRTLIIWSLSKSLLRNKPESIEYIAIYSDE